VAAFYFIVADVSPAGETSATKESSYRSAEG
jgi:hypothetical protein